MVVEPVVEDVERDVTLEVGVDHASALVENWTASAFGSWTWTATARCFPTVLRFATPTKTSIE